MTAGAISRKRLHRSNVSMAHMSGVIFCEQRSIATKRSFSEDLPLGYVVTKIWIFETSLKNWRLILRQAANQVTSRLCQAEG
jgi:hypothetical protein